jgi:CBS domain-containing protein
MGTTVVAVLVTRRLMTDSLLTEKLTRRGLRVHHDYEVDQSKRSVVRDIMTTDVVTLPRLASIDAARRVIEAQPHTAYPLVSADGRCDRLATYRSIAALDPGGQRLIDRLPGANGLPDPPFVRTHPHETVHDLMLRLLEAHAERAVVEVDDRVVGMCTRTDILHLRAQADAHEQREHGWLVRRGRDRAVAARASAPEKD